METGKGLWNFVNWFSNSVLETQIHFLNLSKQDAELPIEFEF